MFSRFLSTTAAHACKSLDPFCDARIWCWSRSSCIFDLLRGRSADGNSVSRADLAAALRRGATVREEDGTHDALAGILQELDEASNEALTKDEFALKIAPMLL